jgi:hypothetical protein
MVFVVKSFSSGLLLSQLKVSPRSRPNPQKITGLRRNNILVMAHLFGAIS